MNEQLTNAAVVKKPIWASCQASRTVQKAGSQSPENWLQNPLPPSEQFRRRHTGERGSGSRPNCNSNYICPNRQRVSSPVVNRDKPVPGLRVESIELVSLLNDTAIRNCFLMWTAFYSQSGGLCVSMPFPPLSSRWSQSRRR